MRFAWRDGERVREVELVPEGQGRWRAVVDGAVSSLEVERVGADRMRLTDAEGRTTLVEVTAAGSRRCVRVGTLDFVFERETRTRSARAAHGGGLEAPMPGVVTRVMVAAGDEVRKGQPLVAIEAMKMEHLIRAPYDGRVRAIGAEVGAMVNGGMALVEMEEADG